MLETQGMKVLSEDARVRYRERVPRSTRPRKSCGSTAGSSAPRLRRAPHDITLHALDPERHVPLTPGCVAFCADVGAAEHHGHRARPSRRHVRGFLQPHQALPELRGDSRARRRDRAAGCGRCTVRHLHVTRAQLMLTRQDSVHLLARPRPGRRQLRAHPARARHLARRVPLAALRLHHHQHQFAPAARHSDGGRHHRFCAQPARCSSSRRSRWRARWRRSRWRAR